MAALVQQVVAVTRAVSSRQRPTCWAPCPVTQSRMFNRMKPKAAPRTTFRSSSITRMLGPAVMTVSHGTITSEMPKMAAAPLPPRKFKKTGQL